MSWLIGRNLDVQKIVEMMTSQDSKRILKIYGQSGNNISLIIRMAVKYCIERNFFKDGFFEIDLGMHHNCHSFMNSLFQAMKVHITDLDDLIEMIESWNVIFLL